MFLVFDTETTGVPGSFRAPVSDVDNWPRVVQLAWAAFGVCGRRALSRSDVIRPDGVPIACALQALITPLTAASIVVAHNWEFDAKVLGAEFHRLKLPDPFPRKTSICTMQSTTVYCAIPNRYGFKWPKLEELHVRLFGREPDHAHDAAADVAACSKCLFELRRLGIVPLPGLDGTTCSTCRAALKQLDVVCTVVPPVY
ncbi:MAG: hypothetical protein WD227_17585 [Vicinamibacterales bacterium]